MEVNAREFGMIFWVIFGMTFGLLYIWVGRISLCIHKDAVRGKNGKTKVIIDKFYGEVSLVEQDIIRKKAFFLTSFYAAF